MDKIKRMAQGNLDALRGNPYPGRGIVAGLDDSGMFLVQVYWIMGRSENSRNRVLTADNETGRLFTEAADPAKMTDPRLVIYNAMLECGPNFIVSNGDQTDTVAQAVRVNYLNAALQWRSYEPDEPNFTQRITAMSTLGIRPCIQMAIQRRSPFGETCDHLHYSYVAHPGFGHCITTYAGDGNPLPAFCGDPLVMPLVGGINEVAELYWDALDETNRISLAVKFIGTRTRQSNIHIVNKYTKVG